MSDSERFSESDRRRYRAFWQTSDRIDKLRNAAAAIVQELGTTDADLQFRMGLILGGSDVPVAKTVGRFFDGGGLDNKPWSITALCWAMCTLCEQQAERLKAQEDAVGLLNELKKASKRDFPEFPPPPSGPRPKDPSYARDALQRILSAIEAPLDETDPARPEFPAYSPRYPATPTFGINVKGREILIKDESYNPTGSHKDRWAWEQLLFYKRIIQLKLNNSSKFERVSIPSMALISSGNAAFALQCLLRLHDLPPLHVVIDEDRVGQKVTDILKAVGAVVHPCDLDKQELDEDDIKALVGNDHVVIDITTRKLVTPEGERFYDWLICEILQSRPRYLFVPFGTGDLYSNIICFLETELSAKTRDRRLIGVTRDDLLGIHVLGATTNERQTCMNKLFAQFRPTWNAITQKVGDLREAGILGADSEICEVSDERALEAKHIADEYNIRTELSGIAGLALLLERNEAISRTRDESILVVNTGWMYTGP